MTALNLNIDNMKFPLDDWTANKPSGKSNSGIFTALKLKSKAPSSSVRKGIEAPKEYSYSDYNIFLIIHDFLQPHSDIILSDAVNDILEVVGNGYSNSRSHIQVCLELAEQIPYHHPSHLKLASILWLIGRSGKRIENSGLKDVSSVPIVINAFYQNLSEDLTDNRADPGDDDTDPMRYVNYQAFLANLQDVGIWISNNSPVIEAMRGAFEDRSENQSPVVRDAWVMGAAQWILWNGQALFKLIRQPMDQNVEPMRITLKKWLVWKEGFKEVADGDRNGEECKCVAKKAFDVMEVLERGMSF